MGDEQDEGGTPEAIWAVPPLWRQPAKPVRKTEEWPEARWDWLAYVLLLTPSGFMMGIGAGIWIGWLIWG